MPAALLKQKEKQNKDSKKEKQEKVSKKEKPPRNDGMMQLDDGMLQLPPSDGTNPFTLFRLGN